MQRCVCVILIVYSHGYQCNLIQFNSVFQTSVPESEV